MAKISFNAMSGKITKKISSLGKVRFLLGSGGGGGEGRVGGGYLRIFLRKKSRPSHFLEWINA